MNWQMRALNLAGGMRHVVDTGCFSGRIGKAPSSLPGSAGGRSHGQAADGSASSWDRTSPSERKLMVAAARLALLELATTASPAEHRPYFAMPGKADWGC